METCAVFIVNRSDYIFESAVSSIVMTIENFKLDKVFIFYGSFLESNFLPQNSSKTNKRNLYTVISWLEKVKDKLGIQLVVENISNLPSNGINNFINEKTNSCDKVLLVPNTSASITAFQLGRLNDPKFIGVNYNFVFGPWTNYFYPYVPRPTEDLVFIDPNRTLNRSQDYGRIKDFPDLYSTNPFESYIEKISFKLNQVNSWDGVLELRDKSDRSPLLDSEKFDLNDFLNKIYRKLNISSNKSNTNSYDRRKRNLIKETLVLSGAFDLKLKGLDDEGISYLSREKVVIDTNMIHYGIHNYELKGLMIPQCVRNEIGVKSVETKRDFIEVGYYNMVEDVLLSVISRSSIIPSDDLMCDIAIPKLDPDLIQDAFLLTADKKAYERWSKSAISKYTKPILVDVSTIMKDDSGNEHGDKFSEKALKHKVKDLGRRYMSIITMANFLDRIGGNLLQVELCWRKGECVPAQEDS
jgi:hypothetical protein